MSTSLLQRELYPRPLPGPDVTDLGPLVELTDENETEILRFLSIRPIHTVFLASLICDNGVASPFNRGVFYGYRNRDGLLEGVALIGHATIIETESLECIEAFARFSRQCSLTHLIRGEEEKIESFWNYYSDGEREARLICRELLLKRQTIPTDFEAVPGLRPASLADIEIIAAVNSSMACEENGIDPLTNDSAGFLGRVARRIRQGRSWILIEDDQLVFKTDIVAQTHHAAYVEGVFVAPEKRGRGYGYRCMSQLTEYLLMRVGAVCLTVNEESRAALSFYRRVGFDVAGHYDTIYLHR